MIMPTETTVTACPILTSDDKYMIIRRFINSIDMRTITDYISDKILGFERYLDTIHNNSDFNNDPSHIPLGTYLRRVAKLSMPAGVHEDNSDFVYNSKMCIVYMYLYIQMFMKENVYLYKNTVCRVCFVGFMMAHKIIHDIPYNNRFFAAISGTWGNPQVNRMEIEFMKMLDWKICLSQNDIISFIQKYNTDNMFLVVAIPTKNNTSENRHTIVDREVITN